MDDHVFHFYHNFVMDNEYLNSTKVVTQSMQILKSPFTLFCFVFVLFRQARCATPPSVNFSLQHDFIECVVHRENTLLIDVERWRGDRITLQALPEIRGMAIRSNGNEDILLLHRSNNALFITIKSSALTLRCQYNMWGMFTFGFMAIDGRFMFSSINMNHCEEVIDVFSGAILQTLQSY